MNIIENSLSTEGSVGLTRCFTWPFTLTTWKSAFLVLGLNQQAVWEAYLQSVTLLTFESQQSRCFL